MDVSPPRPSEPDDWVRAPLPGLFDALGSGPDGLARSAALRRLADDGPNRLQGRHERPLVLRFIARLTNPLIAVLLVASIVSGLLGDRASFGFVAVIVLLSVLLDVLQEHRAGQAALALQQSVALRARVLRDGAVADVPTAELVRGDVVLLAAGSLVPADGRVIDANALFVNQAALTGEAYPVEKHTAGGACISTATATATPDSQDDPLAAADALWMGS
jgi:Mg2+-importing ATPase